MERSVGKGRHGQWGTWFHKCQKQPHTHTHTNARTHTGQCCQTTTTHWVCVCVCRERTHSLTDSLTHSSFTLSQARSLTASASACSLPALCLLPACSLPVVCLPTHCLLLSACALSLSRCFCLSASYSGNPGACACTNLYQRVPWHPRGFVNSFACASCPAPPRRQHALSLSLFALCVFKNEIICSPHSRMTRSLIKAYAKFFPFSSFFWVFPFTFFLLGCNPFGGFASTCENRIAYDTSSQQMCPVLCILFPAFCILCFSPSFLFTSLSSFLFAPCSFGLKSNLVMRPH